MSVTSCSSTNNVIKKRENDESIRCGRTFTNGWAFAIEYYQQVLFVSKVCFKHEVPKNKTLFSLEEAKLHAQLVSSLVVIKTKWLFLVWWVSVALIFPGLFAPVIWIQDFKTVLSFIAYVLLKCFSCDFAWHPDLQSHAFHTKLCI